MPLSAILSFTVLITVFLLLMLTKRSPDTVLFGGLALLVVLGAVSPAVAFSGFSNEGIITIAVLYVVAAALRESGGIWLAVSKFFNKPGGIHGALARVTIPTAVLSGFLNNTPLVLMLLPVINDWAKKYNLQPSKLLIPLSYASILGGMCTLIGTSTNLLVNDMMIDRGMGLSLFTIAPIGVPIAITCVGAMILIAPKVLPDRGAPMCMFENPREYSVEMVVDLGSPLSGQTISEAGLRQLPGLYLMEVERDGDIIYGVGPNFRLQEKDQLVFVGIVDSILDLQRTRGLKPATDQVFKLNAPRAQRSIVEAVVSASSPFVGKSIRVGRFRNYYDAVVIAVARQGQRIRGKIGDIVLEAGDTLLMESAPHFAEVQKNSRDFYLVSQVEGYTPPDNTKGPVALAILLSMVVVVGFELLSMLQGALVASAALILSGCITPNLARRAVDFRLLITIASAYGIGQAIASSGAADIIAGTIMSLASGNVYITLILIYIITMVFTEMITNNASAAIIFPIAMASADGLGANPIPFAIAIMIAASAGFISPIGYQTHLMVYGPGGYRFSDFARLGVIMSLLAMVIALILIPLFWPLMG